MTPREFRQLHAIPFDIKARTRRIQQLEAKQAEGPELVADVVKSSCGDGNACILGHATVRGTADSVYARRELVVDAASRTRSSSQTQSDYLESLKALGTQELAKHTRLENFRFTPTDEVMVGKVVAASLPGTDIQAAARITSITLTSQKGENSVSTEIGTPIIRRRT